MNNVSKLLASAMVAGFLTGSTAVLADHHDKKKETTTKTEKTTKTTKAAKKGGCGSKCKGDKEHKDGEHPAEGGEAHPE